MGNNRISTDQIDPLALTLDDRILLEELITEQIRRVREQPNDSRQWRDKEGRLCSTDDLRGHSVYRLERLFEKVRKLDVKAQG